MLVACGTLACGELHNQLSMRQYQKGNVQYLKGWSNKPVKVAKEPPWLVSGGETPTKISMTYANILATHFADTHQCEGIALPLWYTCAQSNTLLISLNLPTPNPHVR